MRFPTFLRAEASLFVNEREPTTRSNRSNLLRSCGRYCGSCCPSPSKMATRPPEIARRAVLTAAPLPLFNGCEITSAPSAAGFLRRCVRGAVVNYQNPGFGYRLPHSMDHVGNGFFLIERRNDYSDVVIRFDTGFPEICWSLACCRSLLDQLKSPFCLSIFMS